MSTGQVWPSLLLGFRARHDGAISLVPVANRCRISITHDSLMGCSCVAAWASKSSSTCDPHRLFIGAGVGSSDSATIFICRPVRAMTVGRRIPPDQDAWADYYGNPSLGQAQAVVCLPQPSQ